MEDKIKSNNMKYGSTSYAGKGSLNNLYCVVSIQIPTVLLLIATKLFGNGNSC